MAAFDVVCPNFVTAASLPIVLRCLESVRQFSSDYRLIFIDNGSPARDAIMPEVRQNQNRIEILNDANLGFVRATNQGLQISTAPYVVLLNNDCDVCADWLPRMRAAFVGKTGIVGPRSNKNGTISGDLPWTSAHILAPGEMLVFFAVMISRAVIDRIGLLDESFGVGLGDDDAYCWSAQQAGFDLCYLGDLTIFHYHKTTFNQIYTLEQIRRMGWDAVDRLRAKAVGSSIMPQACRYTRPSNI
jgi:GT2 family glycosyltransferase